MKNSFDTVTSVGSSDTITFNQDGTWGIPAFDTITLGSHLSESAYLTSGYANTMAGTGTSPTFTISNSIGATRNNTYTYNDSNGYWGFTNNGKPFIDAFPEWNAFKKLCAEYPGLDKSYENLKTIYTICYEDSILPKDDK